MVEKTIPKVAVLLAVYNGERHIVEQLNTIFAQNGVIPVVYISDDGSKDKSIEVIQNYIKLYPDRVIHLTLGPGRGFAKNFFSLVNLVSDKYEYYSFCDQDDVWHEDKLQRSIAILRASANVPSMYGSRTTIVDEQGAPIGFSRLFRRNPTFSNALVQCIAGGNTMVINRLGLNLLKMVKHVDVCAHDWLTYILIAGVGGNVFYDPFPSLNYRQHDSNEVGVNTTLKGRIKRLTRLISGEMKLWNEKNVSAIQVVYNLLTDKNKFIFDSFVAMRLASFPTRIRLLIKSRVYRQSIVETIAIWAAVIFRRI